MSAERSAVWFAAINARLRASVRRTRDARDRSRGQGLPGAHCGSAEAGRVFSQPALRRRYARRNDSTQATSRLADVTLYADLLRYPDLFGNLFRRELYAR